MTGDCPDCQGHGEVYVEKGPPWWRGSGVYVDNYSCPNCDGTGQVPIEPEEDE